jgi:hypothetical protein
MDMQREAKIADLEEVDEHEAAQDERLKKKASASVGRPKKGRSQLLADVSKMIRDRARQINEAKEKILATKQSLVDEGTKELGTLPADLSAIQTQMTTEVSDAAKKIDKVVEDISGIDPETLITDCAEDAEAIRKALVGKSVDVFKKHLPELNRSIGAFKGAVRSAIKEKSKKAKKKGAQAGGANEVPLLTRTLKELVAKNTDACMHVEVISDLAQIQQIEDTSSVVRLLTLPEAFKKAIDSSPGIEGHLKWMRKQLQKELG